eukprot:jgi/Mesvir1/5092/Mv22441-RA.1
MSQPTDIPLPMSGGTAKSAASSKMALEPTNPTDRAMAICLRTYHRPLEDDVHLERWDQVVDRVIRHQEWLWVRAKGSPLEEREFRELEDLREHILHRRTHRVQGPAVAPYWQFSNDVRIADGHDLLVTGKVILGGAPTEPNDAVTKAYADAIAVVPAALSDATDVEYTGTPSSNDVLAWNGTAWTNTPIRVPYWTEVYHYSGDMSGSTPSRWSRAEETP